MPEKGRCLLLWSMGNLSNKPAWMRAAIPSTNDTEIWST